MFRRAFFRSSSHFSGELPFRPARRLFEAANTRRFVSMRYHSHESRREKYYAIHPYRLVYAQNGWYLQAFVPAYHEF